MRCPKKRRGVLFLLQFTSPLFVPTGAFPRSHCQEPGLRCLCCPCEYLPLLESYTWDHQSTGIPYLPKFSYLSCRATDVLPSFSFKGGFDGIAGSSRVPAVSCFGVCLSCIDPPPRGHALSWQPTTLAWDSCPLEHDSNGHYSLQHSWWNWSRPFGPASQLGFFLCPICSRFLPSTGVEPSEHIVLETPAQYLFLESPTWGGCYVFQSRHEITAKWSTWQIQVKGEESLEAH